jgi:hypothetical protein
MLQCDVACCCAWLGILNSLGTVRIRLGVLEPDRGGPRGPARAHHLQVTTEMMDYVVVGNLPVISLLHLPL